MDKKTIRYYRGKITRFLSFDEKECSLIAEWVNEQGEANLIKFSKEDIIESYGVESED